MNILQKHPPGDPDNLEKLSQQFSLKLADTLEAKKISVESSLEKIAFFNAALEARDEKKMGEIISKLRP